MHAERGLLCIRETFGGLLSAMRVLFLLASGREGGNAELMARHAARALPERAEAVFVRLSDYPLPPFVDYRRAEAYAHLTLDANAEKLYAESIAADVVVFAAPVYWYSLPASLKLYLDHWSTWMRVPGLDFRTTMWGKRLAVLSALAGSEESEARPLVEASRLTVEYMGMHYLGATVGYNLNEAGEVLERPEVLASAAELLRGLR